MAIMTRTLCSTVKKCKLSRSILITGIGIFCMIITRDILREAAPPASGSSSGNRGQQQQQQQQQQRLAVGSSSGRPRSVSAADTEAAVFGQLQTLLETLPAAGGRRCRHQHELGGRCLFCRATTDVVFGQLDGSKPVCLDWLPRRNCSALSFGINNDFSFDDALAELGCSVDAFDPTMGRASFRRSPRVRFHDVGVGAVDGRELGFPVVGLKSAARLAGLEDSAVIDYLKLDVEGSEWEVLSDTSQLRRVTQLAVEFHTCHATPTLHENFGQANKGFVVGSVTKEIAARFVAVVRGLQSADFVLTNTRHGVACQHYDNGCLPYMYETAWVNTRLVSS